MHAANFVISITDVDMTALFFHSHSFLFALSCCSHHLQSHKVCYAPGICKFEATDRTGTMGGLFFRPSVLVQEAHVCRLTACEWTN